MKNTENHSNYNYEANLLELFNILWDAKFKIIFITSIFAIGSVIYALSLPNVYKSSAVLAPAQQRSAVSAALGGVSGVASLLGAKIGNGASTEAQVALQIMRSWGFIESFILENRIETELYYAKDWDEKTDELTVDGFVYNSDINKWVLDSQNSSQLEPPSSWELYQAFLSRTSVAEDPRSGLFNISVEFYSPKIAKEWLDKYVNAINLYMQTRQIDKVTRNILYLQKQISETEIADMREVLYGIVQDQIKDKMLAAATPEYTFVVVSESMVPELKSKPNRATICIIVTLLGSIFSVLIVLTVNFFKRDG